MHKEKDNISRFHKRQALTMLVVLIILVIAFFFMLAKQYDLSYRHEKEILLKRFKEEVYHLDILLERVTKHVDGMRIAANADLLQSRAIKTLSQPLEFKNLTDVTDEKRYHLDTFKPPLTQKMIGNLTGQGSINNLNSSSYREIHMALTLNPIFRAIAEAIKNSAWIYYTSHNNFINIYPWVSSKDFKFSKELYTHEFYTFGLPKNNPHRKRFWTNVYVDEYGKGLMTTCAAPIYDQDRFIGTVAIDLTVDFLNTVVKRFSPEQGVMFLVTDRDQLLAHPSLITSKDKITKTLYEILPEELRSSIDHLNRIPDNQIIRIDSFNILRCSLNQAPWKVFYIEPAQYFWNSFFNLIGIGPVMILAILLILVITAFVITHKQFILPSEKFVNYIMARSKRIPLEMNGKIPLVWKPWFSAIEKVFAENEKLTHELQEQNVNLEHRVKQRTAELENEIEERRRIQETLRESEERFRDISYSMADWIWEIDRNGKYTFASETVKKILGYDPEELIGKKPIDFMLKEEAARIEDLLKRIISGKRPIVDLENWNLSKEGKKVCLLTNGVPILDDRDELIGYRGVDKNITDNKKAEKEQKNLQAQLNQARKMETIGTLAGGIAHDFNNILFPIVGLAELLLEDLPKDSLEYDNAKEILKAGKRGSDLVKQILAFSRQSEHKLIPIRIQQVLKEALKLSRSTIPSNIEISNDIQPDCDLVMADPTQIHQIAMNLITNASYAFGETGGKISIGLRETQIQPDDITGKPLAPGRYAMLSVSDNGCGIETDILDKIFEPYFTTKEKGKGTGLGLAVVHGIVKDHKGDIEVYSTPGKGTTFNIYLPLMERPVETGSVKNEEIPTADGIRILLIDDEEMVARLERQMLERIGSRVDSYVSSIDALKTFRATPDAFDLVVTDMTMPNMTGDQLAKELISIRPDIPVIICTGFSERINKESALAIGIKGFLMKPVIKYEMAQLVRKVLDEAKS